MLVEFLLFMSIFVLLLFKFGQKPKGLPPGDWGPPLIGNTPVGYGKFRNLIKRQSKNYGGGIYCTKIGARTVVIITDYQIMKKAFQTLEFSARPHFHTLKAFGEQLGVSMASGLIWQTNRRFLVKVLKDYGLGKSRMESAIEREIEALIEHFDENIGQPMELSWILNVAIVNILWSIVSDRRYDLKDPEIFKITDMTHENFSLLQGRMLLLDFYPRLEYLPGFIKEHVLHYKALKRNREEYKKYLMDIIEEHVQKLDVENPKNFIDMYLLDVKDITDPQFDFRKNLYNLAHSLINMFSGGSDSTSSVIRWLINYLVIHPDWQEKVQNEIDENIASDHRISYSEDRHKLPILEACVNEAIRKSAVTPLGIPHATTEDCTLAGYNIPKGTIVMSSLEECNHDPKYWERPEEFYPQHFLNDDGTFNARKEANVTFSIGKRLCPGEALAKMDILMMCGAIYQRYRIKAAPGSNVTYDPEHTSSFINFPPLHKLIFEKRF